MINDRVRIKICGFTREEDIISAVNSGIDALGMVFYEKSKRFISLDRAIALKKEIPPFVDLVALFVDASTDRVKEIQDAIYPDYLQFHGDESPELCDSFKQKYLKTFRVGSPKLHSSNILLDECLKYINADGWLFDSYSCSYGGSGKTFNHDILKPICSKLMHKRPIILSGGLTINNIVDSINYLHPWAVDISSGVEIEPGVKSSTKIQEIINAVNKCVTNSSVK
ncbi:phosphoribosylanthranilate isomerase [Candidatus Kinetoplastibacterium oncopeltii TCC290E]|uniref:N-(5'-phosphoribosyl)anthranilate isomerase n=1 Tax=Candidatus Kinetoplastidibacterium stringomonadis TCC290E TaxID=1208920 RepID=M1M8A1_9PROT|nr:phosphoribosylanthranilate isomerase [Candidatus Kinetoplastibacterium oncopeltii]AGF48230.1 phosphoribosylanthranilate isomerase [Candidatus Kinetoplastibacterium oncopeltii TCC290E]